MSVYRPKYRDSKTGETKTSPYWSYEFVFAGRRIREAVKTTRKTVAQEAEKNKRLELERAYAGIPQKAESAMRRVSSVSGVLKEYGTAYAVGHRPNSILWVGCRVAHLQRLLGSRLLPEVTEDRIREYVKTRTGEGASNRTINMELECLARAMGRTWHELWPKFRRLEEPKEVGK